MIMNEKAYKTMSRSGAGALTVGIIMMVAGRYYCSGKRGTFVT